MSLDSKKTLFSLLPVTMLTLSCAENINLDKWKATPDGDEKVEMAERIVSQEKLLGLTLDEVRALVGEPAFRRKDYIYYTLKMVGEDDGFDLNAFYYLACRVSGANSPQVELCVVQGD